MYMQGHVKPGTAAEIACRLWEMGCDEVSMGDTIGVGTPASVSTMFKVCPAQLSLVACFQTLCLLQLLFKKQDKHQYLQSTWKWLYFLEDNSSNYRDQTECVD